MDSKTMMIGGLIVGAGVLYYAYDAYKKSKTIYYDPVTGQSSYNLTSQKGMPTQFSTALDDPLYSTPPASQDDQIVANLPPPIPTGVDAVCGVSTVEEYNNYNIKVTGQPLGHYTLEDYHNFPEHFSQALSRDKTMSGCFPTTS